MQLFASDIGDEQLPVAIEQLWPVLVHVLAEEHSFPLRIRARALSIVHHFVGMAGMTGIGDSAAARSSESGSIARSSLLPAGAQLFRRLCCSSCRRAATAGAIGT